MPLYEHSITGERATLDEGAASVYPKGVWKLVAKQSPQEKADAEALAERGG